MLEQSYEKTIIKFKRAWELLVYLLIKMKKNLNDEAAA